MELEKKLINKSSKWSQSAKSKEKYDSQIKTKMMHEQITSNPIANTHHNPHLTKSSSLSSP
jgi:hypothetical protein